jgi:type I restriction enzyme S subunit
MNVPRLRFKEFSGEWDKKTIEELVNLKVIFKPLDGNHGELHPKSSDYVDAGIPFIMANDIKNNVVDIEGAKKIVKSQADKLQKGFSLEGDVLLTHKGSVGFVAIVPPLSSDYIMLTPQVTYYRVANKQKLSNKFLANFFLSPVFQKELLLLAGGGTRAYLGITDQRSLKVHLPCLPEQTKIANFLTAVDEKIAQLTQKGELLARYKKGAMQQIFSQQLRFKDDDGREFLEWKEAELGELCSITTGKLDANAMVTNGKYRFYTCAKEFYQIDKYAFDTDALLVSGNGANVGYIHYFNGKFNAYQRTYVLDDFEQNIIYIKYFLDENLNARIFKEKKEGNTPYIVLGTLTEMQILLPSQYEQTKIANFLTALDEKISHNKTQLNALKQYKQGLLQQLFV